MSLSSIPRTLRDAVLKRDQGRCTYCRLLQVGQGAIFHIDHIIPRSKGGGTTLDNLALQCPHCSLRKASKTQGIDSVSRANVPFFNPISQNWEHHFKLTIDGEIEGTSPIGRATVEALDMNDVWPRSARALQIAAGWIKL